MAKFKLIDTDENSNGEIVFFTTGGEHYVPKWQILAYIDEVINPVRIEGYGLSSDPDAREETVTVEAEEYYYENTEYVDTRYYKEVLSK